MSHTSKLPIDQESSAHLISFGEKYIESDRFQIAFDGGMGLVEEAAAYLDGQGRKDSRRLDSETAYTYATESMRLTTRLMQIASWLLIRKSVSDGEMTWQRAREEESRLKLIENGLDKYDEDAVKKLPLRLQDLILRSHSYHKQILNLHDMLDFHADGISLDTGTQKLKVQEEMQLLRAAFAR